MQTKKRKHQKIDLTKQKVQYLVEVPLNPSEGIDLIKKSPELVRIDYNDNQKFMNPFSHFSIGGKIYGWSMSNKYGSNSKSEQK